MITAITVVHAIKPGMFIVESRNLLCIQGLANFNNFGGKMNIKFLVIFLIFTSQLFSIPKWLDELDLNLDESEFSRDADCLVYLNEEEIIIKNAESAKIKTKLAFKILNWNAEDLANISFEVNKNEKCSIKGWRFTKDKEWIELSKTAIYEISLSSYSFYYDDAIVKRAVFQDVMPGDIIVYEVDRTVKNWSVTYQSFLFQPNQPTIRTKYSITIPDGWQLNKAEMNLETFNYSNENSTYTWTGENLHFQELEPFSVDWDYLTRSIKLVTIDPEEKKYSFKNWENISKWYAQECSDKIALTSSIQIKTNDLTAESQTNFEKCEKIADFVKSKLRYVAIEVGKNTIIPRPAFKTLENGFGDCKDKAILMISMLSEIGIDAYPVLVNTQTPVQESLPTPFQFNHCIVGIPANQFENKVHAMGSSELLFFDPTNAYSIFGNTVAHLHAENVLVCSEVADLNITSLPLQNPSNNQKRYVTVGNVNEDGSFSAQSKIVYLNNQISTAKSSLNKVSEEDLIKGLLNPINDILKNVDITEIEKQIYADSIVINYKIAGNGIVRNSNPYMVFYPCIYANRYPQRLQNKERKTPLLFGEYKDFTYSTTWTVPETWTLTDEAFHEESICESESIEMDVQINKNKISSKLRLIAQGKAIPTSNYLSAVKYEKEKNQLLNYTLLVPHTGVEK